MSKGMWKKRNKQGKAVALGPGLICERLARVNGEGTTENVTWEEDPPEDLRSQPLSKARKFYSRIAEKEMSNPEAIAAQLGSAAGVTQGRKGEQSMGHGQTRMQSELDQA